MSKPRCACHSCVGKWVGGDLWAAGCWEKSMGGGTMKQNPFKTASTAIDPMPLPTSLRRDDIPVEACTSLMQE